MGGATFSSDWTKHPEWKSHPPTPEEKESYLKTRKMRVLYEQYNYKANRFRPASPKLTRYDIFEPVPGRTNTDDYGHIIKEAEIEGSLQR
jgi:hypothetical protein